MIVKKLHPCHLNDPKVNSDQTIGLHYLSWARVSCPLQRQLDCFDWVATTTTTTNRYTRVCQKMFLTRSFTPCIVLSTAQTSGNTHHKFSVTHQRNSDSILEMQHNKELRSSQESYKKGRHPLEIKYSCVEKECTTCKKTTIDEGKRRMKYVLERRHRNVKMPRRRAICARWGD